jgi:hypothetical protein
MEPLTLKERIELSEAAANAAARERAIDCLRVHNAIFDEDFRAILNAVDMQRRQARAERNWGFYRSEFRRAKELRTRRMRAWGLLAVALAVVGIVVIVLSLRSQ